MRGRERGCASGRRFSDGALAPVLLAALPRTGRNAGEGAEWEGRMVAAVVNLLEKKMRILR